MLDRVRVIGVMAPCDRSSRSERSEEFGVGTSFAPRFHNTEPLRIHLGAPKLKSREPGSHHIFILEATSGNLL